MLKEMRRRYWKLRDQGKAKQVIFTGIALISICTCLTGAVIYRCVNGPINHEKMRTESSKEMDEKTYASNDTEATVSGDSMEPTDTQLGAISPLRMRIKYQTQN